MCNVQTENELISAVQRAKQKNVPAFDALLEKSFFDKCQKNPYAKEVALLRGGLFSLL